MTNNTSYTSEDIKILTDREHVRIRNPIYFGSGHTTQYTIPLLSNDTLCIETVSFIPAVYKAVGEIVDNSLDEFAQISSKVKILKIQASPETGKYSIGDNGRGVPIDKHSSGKFTPEVVFSSLRSGRNFVDDKKIGVQGMNGVGAACTNFCCSEFEITIHRDNKRYHQKFVDGAKKTSKPKITDLVSKTTGTDLTFQLDPLVFSDISLPDSLIRNRAIEIAMTNPNICVEYNGEKFRYKRGIQEYIDKIAVGKDKYTFTVNEENIHGEIYIICNGHEGIDEQMFTWVNSSLLFDGGKCNTQFFNVLFDRVSAHLQKDAKKLKAEVTRNDIRKGLLVLANLKVKNPEYDSQSKTRLTGPDMRKELTTVVDGCWKAFSKTASSWMAEVLERANDRHHLNENGKAINAHEKQIKKRIKVAGLLDATSTKRADCKLLITEGLCLDEHTKIKTVGDIGVVDKALKYINIGDVVITHKGNFKAVVSKTNTIKRGTEIVISGETIICSASHVWLAYNKQTQAFGWIPTNQLDKDVHQMVRSRLGNFVGCDRFNVTENLEADNTQFPYIIQTTQEVIKSSKTHTFIVLNTDTESVEEVACEQLDSDIHLFVLFSSIK